MITMVPGRSCKCLISYPNENPQQPGSETLKVMQTKIGDQVVGAGAPVGVIQPLRPHLGPGVLSPGGQWRSRIVIRIAEKSGHCPHHAHPRQEATLGG